MPISSPPATPARAADRAALKERYEGFVRRGLNLDMTRGKPCAEQLDLSIGLIEALSRTDFRASDGTDCRNYGGLDGLPEAKALFAALAGVSPGEILIGGNSSLNLMHDVMTWAWLYGVPGGDGPWHRRPKVRFLCPVPGYDRHFAICEHLGIEMIPVELRGNGPDMEAVARLAAEDESVKGIWCVPKYSNPTGEVYAPETVEGLARLPARAPDFRIFWDNAYAVHHLGGGPAPLADLLSACRRAGNPERALIFGSTSKISLAGGGIAFLAGSERTLDWARRHLGFQTIGPDKLNQLRHVRFFRDLAGIEAHMQRHAAILKPKFDAVQEVLERELGGGDLASWTRPQGGYFVSLDTRPGRAKRVVALAAKAGVRLTPAGSTFPYGRDPLDRNIRIAPSFPAAADIRAAMEVVAVCIALAEREATA